MSCRTGQQVDNPPEWSNRSFQTPPSSHRFYRPSYQNFTFIVGHTQILYNSSSSATVHCHISLNPVIRSKVSKISYFFGNKEQESSNYFVSAETIGIKPLNVSVSVMVASGERYTLNLESLSFIWQHPHVSRFSGKKGAIVELFGWQWKDIEKECVILGKLGYMGVKIFPPQEAVLSYDQPQNGEINPWYFIYQPVSYILTSRSGSRQELLSMIDTCRRSQVRVYADAVINHMVGLGNDVFMTHRNSAGNNHCVHWSAKESTAGSPYFTHAFQYEVSPISQQRPGLEFPAVPYFTEDFHCERPLRSWQSAFELNYGYLVGLADLNTEKDNVQQRIVDYLTDLLSVGFSGFRIDAAKHISPLSLAKIFGKLKRNLQKLPDDFLTWLEVILGGEKDMLMCHDNHYNYGVNFERLLRAEGLNANEIMSIKIWSSDYPKEHPACGHWPVSSERFVIQNDDHDQQFGGSSSRDMGDKGSVLVKEKDIPKHRHFNTLLFQRTDGNWLIRLVLSSYSFKNTPNGVAYGFPDGLSDCLRCGTDNCRKECKKSMPKAIAFIPDACGYEGLGDFNTGVYTRAHRDLTVVRAMRKWMGLNPNVSNSELGLPQRCQ